MATLPFESLAIAILKSLRHAKKRGLVLTANALISQIYRRAPAEPYYVAVLGLWGEAASNDRLDSWYPEDGDLAGLILHELGQLSVAGMVRQARGTDGEDGWILTASWETESIADDERFEEAGQAEPRDAGNGGNGDSDDRHGGGGGGGGGQGGASGDGPRGRGPGLGEIIAHPTLFAVTKEDLERAVRNAMGTE